MEVTHTVEEDGDAKKSILKRGNVSDFFDHIFAECDPLNRSSLIEAFLHTYRLYSSTSDVLDVAQRNALRLLYSRWLRQPHIRNFDSPTGLLMFQQLINVLSDWCARVEEVAGRKNQHRLKVERPYADKQKHDSLKDFGFLTALDGKSVQRLLAKLKNMQSYATEQMLQFKGKHVHSASDLQSDNSRFYEHPPVSNSNEGNPTVTVEKHESFSRSQRMAEQLTWIDMHLFKDLRLPDLLRYVRKQTSPSVVSTIDQFNAVVNLVRSSILHLIVDFNDPVVGQTSCASSPSLTSHQNSAHQPREVTIPSQAIAVWSKNVDCNGKFIERGSESKRASIIVMWIEIANQLMKLKNYSSLMAVITALQSTPIFRLRRCWTVLQHLYGVHFKKFQEFEGLFDLDNNREKLREQMNRHLDELRRSEEQRRFDRKLEGQQHRSGIIPFLGLYLSDLTFLHAATPDFLAPTSDKSDGAPSRPPRQGHIRRPSSPVHIVAVAGASRPSVNMSAPSVRVASSSSSLNDLSSSLARDKNLPSETCSEKLINFEKHIREAAVLKQIYLFQYSTTFYHIKCNDRFQAHLRSLPTITEGDALCMSSSIEPDAELAGFSVGSHTGLSPETFSRTANSPNSVGVADRSPGSSKFLDVPSLDAAKSGRPGSPSPASPHFRTRSANPSRNAVYLDMTVQSMKNLRMDPGLSGRGSGAVIPSIRVTLQDPLWHPIAVVYAQMANTDCTSDASLASIDDSGHQHSAAPNSGHTTAFAHNNTVQVQATPSDTVSDVLCQVLVSLGISTHLVDRYDLVRVHQGQPDTLLPREKNISLAVDPFSTEPIEYACVPRTKPPASSKYRRQAPPSSSSERRGEHSHPTGPHNRRLNPNNQKATLFYSNEVP